MSKQPDSGGAFSQQASRPEHAEDVGELLNRAIGAHQSGHILAAEALYNRVLVADPRQFDALHMLGIVHGQQGNYAKADELIRAALAVDPSAAECHVNHARVLLEMRRSADALAAADAALALNPNHLGALIFRGSALMLLNEASRALECFDKALALNPQVAIAHCNRGNALSDLKRLDAALLAFGQAIALNPRYPEAYKGRGNVLASLDRRDEALASYDAALAIRPDFADSWLGRGNIFFGRRQFEAAGAAYRKSVGMNPGLAEAWIGLGNVSVCLNRLADADGAYLKAIALKPQCSTPWSGRGLAYARMQRYEDADACYQRAVELDATDADAHKGRGILMLTRGRYADAVIQLEKARALDRECSYALGALVISSMHLCRWERLEENADELIAGVRAGKRMAEPMALLPLNTLAEDQLRCARTFVADEFQFDRNAGRFGQGRAHDKLRLGYVSADFRDHPVAFLTAGLFEHHDRARFETIAISLCRDQPGPMRSRLKSAFDRFVDVHGRTDLEIVELMREMEIDVAVDITGHTQNSRAGIFAARAAPIQVNYLGYPGTMGADFIDYILADRFVVPPQAREHYAEKVVYLPDVFQPNDVTRKISPTTPSRTQAGLPQTGFVFCGFNNSFKITPDVFDIWMRLLSSVDGSVLWLSSTNAGAAANLRREAAQRGVDADRLIFAPRVPLNEDHLARLRLADLFLDTLYYNAHTTAADALWAGVPVLTCAGATFASRVAGSLLHAVGLSELVTASLSDYEALALTFARDPTRLLSLRDKLARNRDVSALFDTARFTRHLEAAYVGMWERYQRGAPTESFAVDSVG